MARKRSKKRSKKRKKRASKEASAAAVDNGESPSIEAHSEPSQSDAAATDADRGAGVEAATDLPPPPAAGEEDEPFVVSLDDEDEEDDLDALIALAASEPDPAAERTAAEEPVSDVDHVGDTSDDGSTEVAGVEDADARHVGEAAEAQPVDEDADPQPVDGRAEAQAVDDGADPQAVDEDAGPPVEGSVDARLGEARGPAPDDANDPDGDPAEVRPALEASDASYGADPEGVDLAADDAGAEVAALLDLGETSTPEDRARLLAEALAHAEMQDARYRVRTEDRTTGRIKGTIALGLFALAGFLVVAPPGPVVPDPPTTVQRAELREGVVTALLLQAEQIDAFLAVQDRLPRALEELDTPLPGIRYVRSSGRLYQLVGYMPTGEPVVFDSAAPSEEFDRVAPAWRREAGS